MLNVCARTLASWESNKRQPPVRLFPGIISYLGQEPWPHPSTLSEWILAQRRRAGLSIAHAAALIGVDENTLGRCERNQRLPRYGRARARIETFAFAGLRGATEPPRQCAAKVIQK